MSLPFTARQAFAAGLTKDDLRGPRFTAIHRGVHVEADTDVDLRALCRTLLLLLPPGSCFSGRTAAALRGWWLPPWNRELIEVTVPPGHNVRRTGVIAHRAYLAADERTEVAGLPVTSPTRTLVDLAACCGLIDLVVLLDSALRMRHVKPAELAFAAREGRRGVRTLRRAAQFANPRSESPMETLTRLIPVLCGLPRPELQVDIYDRDGEWIARADLKVPGKPAVMEYDGSDHRTARRQAEDAARWRLLRANGYEVYPYTARDVFKAPEQILDDYAHALGAATDPHAISRWFDEWNRSQFGRAYDVSARNR